MNLNELRDRAYKTACNHGFHDEELSNEHCLCLVISELMEAVEADRNNKYADRKSFKDYYEDEEPPKFPFGNSDRTLALKSLFMTAIPIEWLWLLTLIITIPPFLKLISFSSPASNLLFSLTIP